MTGGPEPFDDLDAGPQEPLCPQIVSELANGRLFQAAARRRI